MLNFLSKVFFVIPVLFLAVSAFHLFGRGIEEHNHVLISTLYFALSGLAYYGLTIVYHRMRRIGQKQRNSYAHCIFNAVRSGEIQSFGIFLRPFYTTDRIRVRVPASYQGGNVTYFLEDQLVAALKKTIPIVALGRLDEAGVGRILTDDDWQHVAFSLIDHASLIICIPSMRCGTKRELDYIMHNGFLRRTIFLMPPDDRILFKFKTLREDWRAVSDYMASNGINLPEYLPAGLLFSINAKGEYIKEKLDLTSRWSIRRAIERLRPVGLEGNEHHTVVTKVA